MKAISQTNQQVEPENTFAGKILFNNTSIFFH